MLVESLHIIHRDEQPIIRIVAALVLDHSGRVLLVRKRGTKAFMRLHDKRPEEFTFDGRKVSAVWAGRQYDPERLLRAVLLQIFYTVRSERLLMEQMNYNLPFRS